MWHSDHVRDVACKALDASNANPTTTLTQSAAELLGCEAPDATPGASTNFVERGLGLSHEEQMELVHKFDGGCSGQLDAMRTHARAIAVTA